jgi:DNA-binding MarR family transcriptional regulator
VVVAHALADPRRHSIVKALSERREAVPVGVLRRVRGVSAATMSRHIKELERARFDAIRSTPMPGTWRIYAGRVHPLPVDPSCMRQVP